MEEWKSDSALSGAGGAVEAPLHKGFLELQLSLLARASTAGKRSLPSAQRGR